MIGAFSILIVVSTINLPSDTKDIWVKVWPTSLQILQMFSRIKNFSLIANCGFIVVWYIWNIKLWLVWAHTRHLTWHELEPQCRPRLLSSCLFKRPDYCKLFQTGSKWSKVFQRPLYCSNGQKGKGNSQIRIYVETQMKPIQGRRKTQIFSALFPNLEPPNGMCAAIPLHACQWVWDVERRVCRQWWAIYINLGRRLWSAG